MQRVWGIAGLAALVAASAGIFGWNVTAQSTNAGGLQWQDAEVVAQGAEVYGTYCAACHGADLEGQADWQVRRPNGRLPAPPHDETGHTWHHPDALLIDITRYGTAALVGVDYESDMIGFGDLLAEHEIIAVLSYIKSTWPADVIAVHNDINARYANP